MKINQSEKVSWSGKLRACLDDLVVYPRPYQQEIPIRLAVVGTTESAIRAATLKLPMALAIIGGMPERFVPFVNLYKQTPQEAGRELSSLPLGIKTHAFISESSRQAGDDYYLTYAAMMNKIGRGRGWPTLSREQFDVNSSSKGYLMMGRVHQVIINKLILFVQFVANSPLMSFFYSKEAPEYNDYENPKEKQC